jgi:hypothetical protein
MVRCDTESGTAVRTSNPISTIMRTYIIGKAGRLGYGINEIMTLALSRCGGIQCSLHA